MIDRAGIPVAKQPARSIDDLDGVARAAALLLNLDQETVAMLLKAMPPAIADQVESAMASLGPPPNAISTQVIEAFWTWRFAESHQAPDQPAKPGERRLFDVLREVDSALLAQMLAPEPPEAVAEILEHLPDEKASMVWRALPPRLQDQLAEIAPNSADGDSDSSPDLEALESRLIERLEHIRLQNQPRAVESSARYHGRLHSFEDLARVSDRWLRVILTEVRGDEFIVALTTASDRLKRRMFRNAPPDLSRSLKENLRHGRPVRLSEVENAQIRIVEIGRRLGV
ncbi:MAG: hypothetical protein L0Y44_09980 [Phycisphaerales bacterium]|nr:hypothetical protein [Phycisphaerales bacterium]MCI0630965.1 hypothetical protein [Phycisphaerales bacterium]MCI0674328.1 hypothetical protein [Phycisphaerales bacterium]